MKNVSLFSALLVLCSAPAFPQAPDSTSRPATTPDSNSQSDETSRPGNATASKASLTGCILDRNGKYILMTNSQSASNQSTGHPSNPQSSATQSSERPTTSPASQSGTQSGQTSAQANEQSGTQSGTQSRRPQQIELVSTQDLKPHVGHTVRVTGTITNAAAGRDAGNTTSSTPEPNADTNRNTANSANNSNADRATMKVTDIQMIAESCERKGSATPQPH
jgi:hypothetical protein